MNKWSQCMKWENFSTKNSLHAAFPAHKKLRKKHFKVAYADLKKNYKTNWSSTQLCWSSPTLVQWFMNFFVCPGMLKSRLVEILERFEYLNYRQIAFQLFKTEVFETSKCIQVGMWHPVIVVYSVGVLSHESTWLNIDLHAASCKGGFAAVK